MHTGGGVMVVGRWSEQSRVQAFRLTPMLINSIRSAVSASFTHGRPDTFKLASPVEEANFVDLSTFDLRKASPWTVFDNFTHICAALVRAPYRVLTFFRAQDRFSA